MLNYFIINFLSNEVIQGGIRHWTVYYTGTKVLNTLTNLTLLIKNMIKTSSAQTFPSLLFTKGSILFIIIGRVYQSINPLRP